MEEGRASQAKDVLQRHLDKNPDDASAHYALASIDWRMRRYAAAFNALDKAAREDPNNETAHLMRAHSAAEAQGPQEEAAALEELTEAFPANGRAWFLLGMARGATGDYAGQAEALERAAAVGANAVEARTYEAAARALAGSPAAAARVIGGVSPGDGGSPRLAAAAGLIQGMAGNRDAAADLLRTALAANAPGRPQLLTELARILIAQDRYAEAAGHLDTALALEGGNDAARFLRGAALHAQGMYGPAEDDLRQVARTDSAYAAQAATLLAENHLRRNDAAAAQDALEMVDPSAPANAVRHTLRGRAAMMQGDVQGAISDFREALQVDPEYAPAHLELGLAYVQRELMDEGFEALQTYLDKVDPSLPGARTEHVRMLIQELKQSQPNASSAARAGLAN
jgi:tetratricopeptide (TPR) repeat protein